MMRRENGQVHLTITTDEFNTILMALGGFLSAAMQDQHPLAIHVLRVANSINIGNPDWTPYEIPEEPKS